MVMLIDENIKNILGGGYNVREVKYMDKTVWSAGYVEVVIKKHEGLEQTIVMLENQTIPNEKFTLDKKSSCFIYSCVLSKRDKVSFAVKSSGIYSFFAYLNGKEYDSYNSGRINETITLDKTKTINRIKIDLY